MERHQLLCQIDRSYGKRNFVTRALNLPASALTTPRVESPIGAGFFRPLASQRLEPMVRIAITQAAFDAIARTMPLGSVGYENASNENGERLIWLPHGVLGKLNRLRGPGESFSDVILALAASG